MASEPRTFTAYECDHMRPVVRIGDRWHHIGAEGRVVTAGECIAGVYEVEATYSGPHYLSHLVHKEETSGG